MSSRYMPHVLAESFLPYELQKLRTDEELHHVQSVFDVHAVHNLPNDKVHSDVIFSEEER